MISVINKNLAPAIQGFLTQESIIAIEECITKGKKALIYLNRRGAFKTYICKSCSHVWKCPNCDISLTEHYSPKHELLCHHCSTKVAIPQSCPTCKSTKIGGIGVATQALENWLRDVFPKNSIHRLDSDQTIGASADIFVTTEYGLRKIPESLGIVIIFQPENELNIPEFDIEERLYTTIRTFTSFSDECIIETYAPRLPLIMDCLEGNYRSYLERILRERKRFNYPPYTGLAYIHISSSSAQRNEDIGAKILNKLQMNSKSTDSISYDRGMRYKRGDTYYDTILIRSDTIDEIIAGVNKEIVKNSGVNLEIRGRKIITPN